MSITEYDEEGCPCCGRELLMGCCVECGECYEPNP